MKMLVRMLRVDMVEVMNGLVKERGPYYVRRK